MRLAIIDDNPIDRMNLRNLLLAHKQEIAGEAENLTEARALLREHPLDAIFLDVQLGRENGFRLLDTIEAGPGRPQIVFCTLHLHYAADAFDVDAADYLLKPIMPERLARTLQRLVVATGKKGDDDADEAPVRRLELDDLLAFRQGDERRILEVGRIAAIAGEGDYSRVIAADGREYLDNRRLRDWQRLLPARRFQTLDRSTIINLAEVVSWRQNDDGARVTLRNSAHPFPIGHLALRRLEKHADLR
ncbi:response regulator of the LytR/AlgR family [Opitutaceae bacterium TAV1]|nr:LytTR family transcriptional regulator [Opitutaceae bacterium TAV5]EIP96394.1 response regulator of the LytR/AlgR family [Opitutaceae bacterium TAV1]